MRRRRSLASRRQRQCFRSFSDSYLFFWALHTRLHVRLILSSFSCPSTHAHTLHQNVVSHEVALYTCVSPMDTRTHTHIRCFAQHPALNGDSLIPFERVCEHDV